jgi:hypothetical protein
MRQFVLALAIVLILPATASAAENGVLERDSINLAIGDREVLQPGITNQLDASDTVTVEFKGGAAENGIVDWEIEEGPNVNCNVGQDRCNITIGSQETQRFDMELYGRSFGEGDLVLEGTSQATRLSGDDSLRISVSPTSSGGETAPGMTGIYLVLLLAAAAGYVAVTHRH